LPGVGENGELQMYISPEDLAFIAVLGAFYILFSGR
jgi:hypothetical protein